MRDIFQKFFEDYVGSNSYPASKYGLRESYANSVMVEVTSGGSSGGDCYGGYTSRYDKNDADMQEEMFDEILYKFKDLCLNFGISQESFKKVAKEKTENLLSAHSHITDTDEGGDYYGNYTSYRLYEINVLNLLDGLLDDNTFHELQEFASDYSEKADKNLQQQQLKDEEINLLAQVENFDNKSDEEKTKLKTNLADYKKKVVHIEKLLAGFDLKIAKDKKNLEKKLADVQILTGTPQQEKTSSDVKTSKKKM